MKKLIITEQDEHGNPVTIDPKEVPAPLDDFWKATEKLEGGLALTDEDKAAYVEKTLRLFKSLE